MAKKTIRRVRYRHTTVPHEPGEGARVLGALRDREVDLLAFHAFPREGAAQLDFVAKDDARLVDVAREAGIELSEPKTAFLIQDQDRPGAVAEVLGKLAEAEINLTAMDAVSAGDVYGALFWVSEEDLEAAARALGVT